MTSSRMPNRICNFWEVIKLRSTVPPTKTLEASIPKLGLLLLLEETAKVNRRTEININSLKKFQFKTNKVKTSKTKLSLSMKVCHKAKWDKMAHLNLEIWTLLLEPPTISSLVKTPTPKESMRKKEA